MDENSIELSAASFGELRPFISTEGHDFTMGDLSYHKFENINFLGNPVSFYRTDFSHSLFENCNFVKNCLSRADFIVTKFENCSFRNVEFGNCIFKDSYFKNVDFFDNSYNFTHFDNSVFIQCTFTDESFIAEIVECLFVECKFISVKNEMGQMKNLEFMQCSFENSDFAECYASDLIFNRSNASGLTVDSSLWLSYYYVQSNIKNMLLKHHGEYVGVEQLSGNELMDSLIKRGRYFELLNFILIYNNISKNCSAEQNWNMLFLQTTEAMKKIPLQEQHLRRNNVSHLLKLVEVNYNNPDFNFETYLNIVGFLNSYNWDQFPLDETLEYRASLQRVNTLVERFDFSEETLNMVSPSKLCLLTVRTNIEEQEIICNKLDVILSSLSAEYQKELSIKNQIVSVERGSLYVTALMSLLIASLLIKVLAQCSSIFVQEYPKIKIAISVSKRQKELIERGILDDDIIANAKKFLSETLDETGSSKPNRLSKDISKYIASAEITEVGLEIISSKFLQ